MANDKNLKSKKIAIVALLLLLGTIIGATYAFFTAQKGTGGSAQIEVGAGTTDSLTFNNEEGDITIVANQDNFGKSNESITDTASVKAKLVPNNNTNSAHETYNIFLVVENNDLVYTKDNSSPELLLKITDPEHGEYSEEVEGLKYYENVTDKDTTSYKGYDITTSSNQVYKIVSDYHIDAEEAGGTEQTWQVEATLVNLDQDQNNNTGKTFEGSIYITTDEDFKLSEVNTLKTTATTNSIEAVADITNGTNKIANYYFAIEKTSETPETIKLSSVANALEKEYTEETSNTHTFSENIEENQNYKIYTYTIDEQGYKSNVYETVVTAKDGEIPEVGEVEISSTFYSITLNFPSTEGIEYRVSLDNDNWLDFSSENSKTITGLEENTIYKLNIQAKNEEGLFSNIKTIKVKTLKKPEKLKLTDYVMSKSGTRVGSGTEEIIYHTAKLEKSAGDNSYRYTGANPDNYVCFDGKNISGECTSSDDLYRIIGIFLNEGNYYAKLIKYDYTNSEQAGNKSEDGAYWNFYPYTTPNPDNYRGDGDFKTKISYWWNGNTHTNKWEESYLNSVNLNELFYNYLITKNPSLTNFITDFPWHINGCSKEICSNGNAKQVFNAEINNDNTLSKKIGLMYISDYMYAADKKHWNLIVNDTNGNDYRLAINDNWLFMGLHEWVITSVSDNTNDVYHIDQFGVIYSVPADSYDAILGIRPTFYLNSDIKIIDGDGTIQNPFQLG